MTSLEHAQALYDEVAERPEGTVDALKARLMERALEVRQGLTDTTRSEVAVALEQASPEERTETAAELQHAADDLDEAFRGSSLTLKKLDDDVAGEAQLGTNTIRIDPGKLTGADGIIDVEKAKEILVHEQEHTQQSAQADAETVTIGREAYDTRAVREMAAISCQKRIDFLSDEYRRFAQVTMDEGDRALVRAGRFRELEAKKNEGTPVAMAA